ncbi:UvrABC system protein C [Porphyridium purpureum]|uniref:UvrABC system protein C n=1 Tax=Porphyridium purpureum TaxID=35688 RepID=A0A5J4YKJ3_PORPP|nr:UvrABC system protein C [Porphyridium purpureum]|eukprot:POR6870..scf261_15
MSPCFIRVLRTTTTAHARARRRLLCSYASSHARARTGTSTTAKLASANDERSDAAAVELGEKIKRAPERPGCYLFVGESRVPGVESESVQQEVLYVGKAKNLRSRLLTYLTPHPSEVKTVQLMRRVRDVRYMVTASEEAALVLESQLVRTKQPQFNILLKDDKRFPYICITYSEEYPHLKLIRRRRAVRSSPLGSDVLYGPFVDSAQVQKLLKVVTSLFALRQREKPLFKDRPCLNYDLGRCPGVCQQLISATTYRERVKQAELVLQGRIEKVVSDLNAQMAAAAALCDFERAARIRDQRNNLLLVLPGAQSVKSVVSPDPELAADLVTARLVSSNNTVLVQIMQVRAGRILSSLRYCSAPGPALAETFFGRSSTKEKRALVEQAVQQVLQNHYLESADGEGNIYVPPVILSDTRPANSGTLLASLALLCGRSAGESASANPTPALIIASASKVPPAFHDMFETARCNADLDLEEEESGSAMVGTRLQDLSSMIHETFGDTISGSFGQSADSQEGDSRAKPLVIECFDISHLSGTHCVASCVRFVDGQLVPRSSRTYRLGTRSSSLGEPDDYESMREALRRRFADLRLLSDSKKRALIEQDLPDLILVDGGKGQLSAAHGVLVDELGLLCPAQVVLLGLAKKEEQVFRHEASEPINLDSSGSVLLRPGVMLLCRIRDEAHRKAITTHRRIREKTALSSSVLEDITGLGPKRTHALLQAFEGNIKKLQLAKVDDISQVPGISRALAERVALRLSLDK